MSLPLGDLELLAPVLARILSALMTAPVFSQRNVPALAKIVLAGILAWLLVLPGGMKVERPATATQWLAGLAAEVLIGLFLGFMSSLAFWGLSMAGEMVGTQMGWGFPGTLHASLDTSPTALGQLYLAVGTLIFLFAGGHQLWLKALAQTFVAAPPFALVMTGLQLDRVLSLLGTLFTGAVQLALPVIGTLMLVEVMLAFLTKVLPQLNAWVFGMPLKVGVGLLALWLTLPVLTATMQRWLMAAPASLKMLMR
jgi:flagellar biosynthesis protein FliR